MFGRIVAVTEKYLGSALSEGAGNPGVIGVLGTVQAANGAGLPTVTIPVTVDAAGDSMVVMGGGTPGHVPTGCTDSKGNTYHLGIRSGYGAGGVDAQQTNGLDGTAWVFHGDADGGQLRVGDSIILTGFTTGSVLQIAAAFDTSGLAGDSSADAPTASGGVSFGGTFTVDSSTDPVDAVELCMTVGLGLSASGPTLSGITTIQSTLTEGSAGAIFGGQLTAAGEPPAALYTAPGGHWAEGVAVCYRLLSASSGIVVDDAIDFDDEGQLIFPGGQIYDYVLTDEDAGTITLDPPLAESHLVDESVRIYPQTVERWATVISFDSPQDEEGMVARVPHALFDRIPVGIRDQDTTQGETVVAEFERDELVIVELTGQAPVVDGSFIVGTTLPVQSDGYPPGYSPEPQLVAGDDHIKARWTAVATNSNGDPQTDIVAYDVYVSDGSEELFATLDSGSGNGRFLLTAVAAGAEGDEITLTVVV